MHRRTHRHTDCVDGICFFSSIRMAYSPSAASHAGRRLDTGIDPLHQHQFQTADHRYFIWIRSVHAVSDVCDCHISVRISLWTDIVPLKSRCGTIQKGIVPRLLSYFHSAVSHHFSKNSALDHTYRYIIATLKVKTHAIPNSHNLSTNQDGILPVRFFCSFQWSQIHRRKRLRKSQFMVPTIAILSSQTILLA